MLKNFSFLCNAYKNTCAFIFYKSWENIRDEILFSQKCVQFLFLQSYVVFFT